MVLKTGSQRISSSFSVGREHSKVMTFIKSIMPSAKFIESVGTDLTVALPHFGDNSTSLHDFFRILDAQLADLGVLSYGVSNTTLEEVFLKVTAAFAVFVLLFFYFLWSNARSLTGLKSGLGGSPTVSPSSVPPAVTHVWHGRVLWAGRC